MARKKPKLPDRFDFGNIILDACGEMIEELVTKVPELELRGKKGLEIFHVLTKDAMRKHIENCLRGLAQRRENS